MTDHQQPADGVLAFAIVRIPIGSGTRQSHLPLADPFYGSGPRNRPPLAAAQSICDGQPNQQDKLITAQSKVGPRHRWRKGTVRVPHSGPVGLYV
jgi:hypothetical protein